MTALSGPVVRLGDDVNTDVMLPGKYLNLSAPEDLAPHLLETYDAGVAERVVPGTILVAGRNFGMGSSREHAPIAMIARGVQVVVAVDFARIFYRNCVNLGLPAIAHPEAATMIADGATVAVDLSAGTIESDGTTWSIPPAPPFLAELLAAGGLVEWTRRRLAAAAEPS